MEAELSKLRDGKVTFSEFARGTRDDWRSLAAFLMRRYSLPAAVELRDVEQELLASCWRAVGRWEPERGVALKRYVVWNAIRATQHWLDRQRSAGLGRRRQRGEALPSRHALTFTELGESSSEAFGMEAQSQAEAAVELSEVRARALNVAAPAERPFVAALFVSGSPEQAAEAVYSDPDLRRELRLDSARVACRLARQALERVKEAVNT